MLIRVLQGLVVTLFAKKNPQYHHTSLKSQQFSLPAYDKGTLRGSSGGGLLKPKAEEEYCYQPFDISNHPPHELLITIKHIVCSHVCCAHLFFMCICIYVHIVNIKKKKKILPTAEGLVAFDCKLIIGKQSHNWKSEVNS